MKEQLLGSELRGWCQAVGLLEEGADFADRRSPDTPTVRLARTLLVNFDLGRRALKDEPLLQPVLCKSGGIDDEYHKLREQVDWSDVKLSEMGNQFVRLHKSSNAEFARKALSLSVVASWAYTYRGLGTRNSPKELGRMLEVFLVLAEKGKPKITKQLANAAIQSYEAKRAVYESNKVLAKI
jgi:hypothetical protein